MFGIVIGQAAFQGLRSFITSFMGTAEIALLRLLDIPGKGGVEAKAPR